MTITFSFYRIDTVTAPDGRTEPQRVEVRPPVSYDPGSGVDRFVGFTVPCRCPQAPACHRGSQPC